MSGPGGPRSQLPILLVEILELLHVVVVPCGRGPLLGCAERQHVEPRLGAEQRYQLQKIIAGKGDAASRRTHVVACDVEEDGAAPFALRWVVVVADHDQEVVE